MCLLNSNKFCLFWLNTFTATMFCKVCSCVRAPEKVNCYREIFWQLTVLSFTYNMFTRHTMVAQCRHTLYSHRWIMILIFSHHTSLPFPATWYPFWTIFNLFSTGHFFYLHFSLCSPFLYAISTFTSKCWHSDRIKTAFPAFSTLRLSKTSTGTQKLTA